MEVRDSIDLGDGHSIEIGEATWDTAVMSIRNRYSNARGGFNLPGSSEIALDDLEALMTVAAARDLLDISSSARIVAALTESIARQTRT